MNPDRTPPLHAWSLALPVALALCVTSIQAQTGSGPTVQPSAGSVGAQRLLPSLPASAPARTGTAGSTARPTAIPVAAPAVPARTPAAPPAPGAAPAAPGPSTMPAAAGAARDLPAAPQPVVSVRRPAGGAADTAALERAYEPSEPLRQLQALKAGAAAVASTSPAARAAAAGSTGAAPGQRLMSGGTSPGNAGAAGGTGSGSSGGLLRRPSDTVKLETDPLRGQTWDEVQRKIRQCEQGRTPEVTRVSAFVSNGQFRIRGDCFGSAGGKIQLQPAPGSRADTRSAVASFTRWSDMLIEGRLNALRGTPDGTIEVVVETAVGARTAPRAASFVAERESRPSTDYARFIEFMPGTPWLPDADKFDSQPGRFVVKRTEQHRIPCQTGTDVFRTRRSANGWQVVALDLRGPHEGPYVNWEGWVLVDVDETVGEYSGTWTGDDLLVTWGRWRGLFLHGPRRFLLGTRFRLPDSACSSSYAIVGLTVEGPAGTPFD